MPFSEVLFSYLFYTFAMILPQADDPQICILLSQLLLASNCCLTDLQPSRHRCPIGMPVKKSHPGELHLLGCLSLPIPSSHLPKAENQNLFWNPHLLNGHTQGLSALGPSLITAAQCRPFHLFPGKAPMLFFLADLSFCLSPPFTPTHSTRLDFPKHISSVIIFPEKPKMGFPTLQDNPCTTFKYFMVWFPTYLYLLPFFSSTLHPSHISTLLTHC